MLEEEKKDTLFLFVVWNFELYVIPLVLLFLLTWNYFILSGKDNRQCGIVVEDMLEDEEEDDKDKRLNKLSGIVIP